ncbi:E3 ubiquitin-protein ligase SIRP1-like [Euphorbia lathyris]|uniref:E3 ubiquitin-protein ligase SIRP1-like n=1 Tax=Euphorbia lathyris TaxID=212925 RepID=UPI0033140882
MEEAMAARYWCHMCSQIVHPIMEIEMKCPTCQSGFVEEMSSDTSENQDPDLDISSDRALSLWAPILLGMMGNPRRRRRFRRMEFEEDDDENDDSERESELDREFESFMRRRRRSSATVLQLLQGIRAGMASESDNNSEGGGDRRGDIRVRDRERDRDRERVILINPLNRTIIVQGSYDSRNSQNQNHTPIGSLGDYFIGPGLDLLLQHLAENDPNRYGTPPAQKEAIEALPTVTIKDIMQCSVCLDDFEIGTESKEMPCKHKFHTGCLLPWLELHSSCPVCRFQLPAEESKSETSERSRNTTRTESDHDHTTNNHNSTTTTTTSSSSSSSSNRRSGRGNEAGEAEVRNGNGNGNGNGRRFAFPWPFNSLFPSSSGSQSGGSSTGNASGNGSHTDET